MTKAEEPWWFVYRQFCKGKHWSFEEVARTHMDRNVGRNYKTANDVFNAPDSTVTMGLLRLIFKELEICRCEMKQHRNEVDSKLAKHVRWMQLERPTVERLLANFNKELSRISKFCTSPRLRERISRVTEISMEGFRRNYVYGGQYFEALDDLRKQIARMRKVKKLEDVTLIKGVGKKYIEESLQRSKK